ncbi:MAG: hypothetical protein R3320_02190 [Nitriliruptorales bacterium]|nr:hypothetical protein [Nitriliruptorales bacterium]
MASDDLAVGRTVEQTTPAIPSSSVILVRDGDCGLEVFMLERHIETDFAGGALVFPGGKVEEQDRELPADRWRGAEPDQAAAVLGTPAGAEALGLMAAAVRETFEEAGVLLATRAGTAVGAGDLASESFAAARARLNDRSEPWDWRPWLEEQELVLDLGTLAFFSWWATPDGLHRRYDTRFFVVAVPEPQAEGLAHDAVETTDSRWLRPAEALSLARRERATVVYPTRKNLEALATYPTAAELLEATREGRTDRRRLQPRLVEVSGRTMVQHPDGGPPEPG